MLNQGSEKLSKPRRFKVIGNFTVSSAQESLFQKGSSCNYYVTEEERVYKCGPNWNDRTVLDEDTPFSLGLISGGEIYVRQKYSDPQRM